MNNVWSRISFYLKNCHRLLIVVQIGISIYLRNCHRFAQYPRVNHRGVLSFDYFSVRFHLLFHSLFFSPDSLCKHPSNPPIPPFSHSVISLRSLTNSLSLSLTLTILSLASHQPRPSSSSPYEQIHPQKSEMRAPRPSLALPSQKSEPKSRIFKLHTSWSKGRTSDLGVDTPRGKTFSSSLFIFKYVARLKGKLIFPFNFLQLSYVF